MIDTLVKSMKDKIEFEVETVVSCHYVDDTGIGRTRGIYKGRITHVGKDYILLKLDDYVDKNTKRGYIYYPELIRIDKIVSIRRVNNCEIMKDNRRGN